MPYRVRGEVGEYDFEVYDSVLGKCVHDFVPLRGKTFRQTLGFRDRYVHQGCTQRSYRAVANAYSRECYQEGKSCSSRTFQDMVVREGRRIEGEIDQWSAKTLQGYGIEIKHCTTSIPKEVLGRVKPRRLIEVPELEAAFKRLHQNANPAIQEHLCLDNQAYESVQHTINISIDDVCCKRQKDKRTRLSKQQILQQRQVDKQRQDGRKNYKKRKMLYQCVSHFESPLGQYTLVGPRLKHQLGPILAFLLDNEGLKYNWVFFVDGQRSLNECIENRFSWHGIDMILDWYHLHKKLIYQSFLALKKCKERDKVLQKLKQWLWYGLVDQAIKCLNQLDGNIVRKEGEVKVLKNYLRRNQSYIKCYALRKELGLRISSNRVEKSNDILVADRQKNNGMSFTRPGAEALALLTNVQINQEKQKWLKQGKLRYTFAA